MQQEEFGALLRHLLANIHDAAVLEKHPLNDVLSRGDVTLNRAEALRRRVATAIELLKPQQTPFSLSNTEWRYYLILHGRYVEGAQLPELQSRLALGDRQERRLHLRALSLLEAILYAQVTGSASTGLPVDLTAAALAAELTEDPEEEEEAVFFRSSPEALQVRRVLEEVLELCAPRIHARGVVVTMHLPANLPLVDTDRIILRQILLHLFNTVLATHGGGDIAVTAYDRGASIDLELVWQTVVDVGDLQRVAEQAPLRYWLAHLQMQLAFVTEDDTTPGPVQLVLTLPVASLATLLVVDDHESAIRIVQRYLQAAPVRVVGETDPARVTMQVRTLCPDVLLLDVMMPTTDGWELLQRIKSDPEISATPVIICSVWAVPDLALSLGASDFLKKPIDRQHLLAALSRLVAPELSAILAT